MTKYDNYELLELFEKEPFFPYKGETEIFDYSKNDEFGFKFTLYVNIYEETCIVSLRYKDFKVPIFDIKFEKITNIKCDNEKIILTQENRENNIIISVKPSFSINL
ncbi:MAG: hypothetical protein FWF46_01835 [Oscillospiraceae bacterium]|nr:hypothetical protein [Oscillospiraceae bacterium]